MSRTSGPGMTRRGALVGLVFGVLALAGSWLGRRWPGAAGPAVARGCRRVVPWSDEALFRPHDRAG